MNVTIRVSDVKHITHNTCLTLHISIRRGQSLLPHAWCFGKPARDSVSISVAKDIFKTRARPVVVRMLIFIIIETIFFFLYRTGSGTRECSVNGPLDGCYGDCEVTETLKTVLTTTYIIQNYYF